MGLVPDGQGGVWVEMTGVPLGPPYAVDDTFLVFLLPFTLPASDIYPMFVRADLARLDGSQLGDGFQVTKLAWPGESSARPVVVQVSRRTRGSLTAQTAPPEGVKGPHLGAHQMTAADRAVPDIELRFRATDWSTLQGHLFPGDDDEHGAVLLCGQVRIGSRLRLLVRSVIPAKDGVDYVPGTPGYRHLDGAFVTRQLRVARDTGLVYLAAHNHHGRDSVAFSGADLASHERGYPTLLALNKSPVGGLVLAQSALAADIWLEDGSRCRAEITTVVGEGLARVTEGHDPGDSESAVGEDWYARQALIFGDRGQAELSRLKLGIVGAGGVGMLVVQALGRLGVGAFVADRSR